MVTGKTAAEEWDDSSSVVSSADTNVSLPRVHHRIDSRVNQCVEGNSPSTSALEYRASAQKANQTDKEVTDARVRAERQQEDQRRAEDRAFEQARLMNDRKKEDEAKAARRLKEDHVRQDERNRENELAVASDRAEKSLYRRDFQQRFYRR
ncbi:hypothetical protein RvY_18466 [Ramazzottius varieornatus]|uniref:Uncharacterized protein n=1 Tax=Ramazzottius varieornatus TaxID=947166 RepID=A0A1D1W5V4_RAMVA|nr:hypothetical protein RvY_18466 [Ramazzottius varieornatus]